ncbi:ABC transporter substrate-binding protein [Halomarina oriensis]|uniref:ABC transporter substrate-binding protein n=1 Tax=Halomarina oriensis TaxID=671145 RepID=A0A6B0GDN7_9EURY|nr:ABC transporter substrate-binding protein [Halomarina oriensis]MWG33036.1 ABC transporter substrate-binding protein [Halomarina oriensis]
MDANRQTRRRVLATLGATGVAALAGCTDDSGSENGSGDGTDGGMTDGGTTDGTGGGTTTGTAGASVSGTLKVGVVQPVSGDLQYYGQQALWGFYSGLGYKGEASSLPDASTGTKTMSVGDLDVEMHVRDTKLDSQTAQEVATDLVTSEEVDLLFGGTSSAAATRIVNSVTKQSGVPTMIGPAASADITSSSETCTDLVFRASENTAMDARSGGRYVAENSDVSSVYLFGADYSFGRAVVNNYRTVLEANGVEIVGERFVPQGYSEWTPLLDQAVEAGAEGIVGGFTVSTLPALFTTVLNGDYDFRVFGGFATQITTQIVGQTMQKVLGDPLTADAVENSNLGPFTTRYHWNQYDNPINDRFVELYSNAYGAVPDLFTSGTFTAASAIVQAAQSAGSTDGSEIADALRGMTVRDTPKGEGAYTFQEYNNQARSPMTVANVVPNEEDRWNAPVMPSEPVATISKDRTTIPADSSEMNCSL